MLLLRRWRSWCLLWRLGRGWGLLAHGSSPEEMLADQRAELQRWKPLIKEIGFTLDS